jgi:holo-[acyl-carrier protein] synthase
MKIIGTGIDIVEIARITKSYERFEENFASKILHDDELIELEASNNKSAFLAKRFAVKEAFVKALGTGIRDNVHWRKMYVQHDAKGKPSLMFTSEFAQEIKAENLDVHISISDETNYVVAQALIFEQSA